MIFCVTTGCAGRPPAALGLHAGRLAPCPPSPNCVCSQCDDPAHFLPPWPYPPPLARARAELKQALLSLPRSRIVTESDDYLHAEFTSAVWGFVDDGEFYFDQAHGLIQFRSAARLGYGDFGVNRRRLLAIRQKLPWLRQRPEPGTTHEIQGKN